MCGWNQPRLRRRSSRWPAGCRRCAHPRSAPRTASFLFRSKAAARRRRPIGRAWLRAPIRCASTAASQAARPRDRRLGRGDLHSESCLRRKAMPPPRNSHAGTGTSSLPPRVQEQTGLLARPPRRGRRRVLPGPPDDVPLPALPGFPAAPVSRGLNPYDRSVQPPLPGEAPVDHWRPAGSCGTLPRTPRQCRA